MFLFPFRISLVPTITELKKFEIIFFCNLQEVIATKLSDSENDLEVYLTTMYDLYSRFLFIEMIRNFIFSFFHFFESNFYDK